MYLLLNRIPNGLDPLRERFELHVKKAGLDSVEKAVGATPESAVCCLLNSSDMTRHGDWSVIDRDRIQRLMLIRCFRCIRRMLSWSRRLSEGIRDSLLLWTRYATIRSSITLWVVKLTHLIDCLIGRPVANSSIEIKDVLQRVRVRNYWQSMPMRYWGRVIRRAKRRIWSRLWRILYVLCPFTSDYVCSHLSMERKYVDDCVQIYRRQRRVPEVLLEDAREATHQLLFCLRGRRK